MSASLVLGARWEDVAPRASGMLCLGHAGIGTKLRGETGSIVGTAY